MPVRQTASFIRGQARRFLWQQQRPTVRSWQQFICLVFVLQIYGKLSQKMIIADISMRLLSLPEKIQRVLDEKERLQWLANKFSHVRDVFFIGRGAELCDFDGRLVKA